MGAKGRTAWCCWVAELGSGALRAGKEEWGVEVRARRDARGQLGLLCRGRVGCMPSTFSTLLGNMP